MIVTKAYIVSLPAEGDNKFRVNVPLMNDNFHENAEFDALLCHDPSCYNGYNVGDCVYVTFEDDLYNIAVILGRLYTGVADSSSTYGIFNSIKVENTIELPEDTKLGKYNAQDIFDLYQNGSGSSSRSKDDQYKVKKYVKYDYTEEEDPIEGGFRFSGADTIKCMMGETGDTLNSEGMYTSEGAPLYEGNLFFLTSVPPSEKTEII